MSIEFDMDEFDRTMRDLAMESDRADAEIVTMNAKQLLRALVYNSPRDTGATRAGFWPAWEALDMPGTPGTRRRLAPFQKGRGKKKQKRVYVPEGKYVDKRQDKGNPSFEFSVSTHYIDRNGKKVHYPYILNAKENFWGKGHREATWKFQKVYDNLLKKHSAT